MTAPVILEPLDTVPLMPGAAYALRQEGLRTIGDLVDYVDIPDKGGRTGLRKLGHIRGIGKVRVKQIDTVFVNCGVDLSREGDK